MKGNLQKFINDVQDSLKKWIDDEHDDPIRIDRLAQIARAKKAALYWQGKQYLAPKFDADSLTIDWVPVAFDREKKKVFNRVDNVILGDGIKYAALLGQRKLNQRCVPDDPDNIVKVQAARNAFTMAKYLHRYWRLQVRIANEVAQVQWVSGPVYAFEDYVADALKHGHHEEPRLVPKTKTMPGTVVCGACGNSGNPEGEMACGACGAPLDPSNTVPGPEVTVPEQDGVERYEKGMPELTFLTCLHVTTPFEAKSLEECGWLDYSQVLTKRKAEAEMRRLRVKTKLSSEDEESVRRAHEALLELASPTADSSRTDRDDYVYSQRWLRPSEYESMDKQCREAFQEQFPDGVRLYRMGEKLVFAEADRMDDHWKVCPSGVDSYINAPGLCDSMMSFQDYWNDFWNMAAETLMRGMPKTIVDSQLIDTEWLKTSDGQIGEMLLSRMSGIDMSKASVTIPTARFPAELPAVSAAMRQGMRDTNGIQPAMYGANEGSQTWREANQKKNQAMAQFQPNFEKIQAFGCGITEMGVKLAAKHGFGKVLVSPEGYTGLETVEEIDLRELSEDGYHFEAEEVIPQTIGEMKEAMAGLATEAPQIAQATGMFHIMNAPKMQVLFGDPSMYVPGQYERDRIMERIQVMLTQQPMQEMQQIDPLNPMSMAPVEKCSMPPDPVTDKDHTLVGDIVRVWLSAPAGRRAEKENPVGYHNVWLHCQEQDQMAMATMAPPPAGPNAPAPAGAPSAAQPQPAQ